MLLIDFLEITSLNNLSEVERTKLLCYFHYKESNEDTFDTSTICSLLAQCGFNKPNISRLVDKLTKGKEKVFLSKGKTNNSLHFIPTCLQNLEREYASYWNDFDTIISSSDLIDEVKFCGKRKYIDKIIFQINHSYANNCYDACAVLMRRLFEVLLILTYQNFDIDDDIKDPINQNYIMLDAIVKKAKNCKKLKLSRIRNEFDVFRNIGNFSAHSITYTAGKKDIDDIKLNYRVMLEELFNKSGLTE